jgi:hypothetical protein
LRTWTALAAVALVGCTAAPQSAGTPTPVVSPSPITSTSADSKAADFRVRLDLLLGEHVLIIAKESSAPARQSEYTSYLRLLTANGTDLTELVRSAMGDSLASRFEQIWSAQNDHLVSYTIALVTHNQAKTSAAMIGMSGMFVPQFSQFLSDVAQIPSGLILPLVTQHMLETKAILDDQFLGNYPALYASLRMSYAHATQVGDAVAPRIAEKFPDKFPGNASSPAVDLRASLNIRLQEHSYLGTMRTSAAIGGRTGEAAAAAGALAENANALDATFTGLFGASVATRFDQAWAAGDAATSAYATAPTAAAKQRAMGALNDASITQLSSWLVGSTDLTAEVSRPGLEAQLEAVVTVIDDQRSKSWSRVAADDKAAETATEVVADIIASAAIAKLRARFG